MLWLRAGVWMELILPGGSRRPHTAFGNFFEADLGSAGSIQPGLFHVGVHLSADGSRGHVFLRSLAFCLVSHVPLLSHPSSQLLPPLLTGTPDPAWRMVCIASLGVCPSNQRALQKYLLPGWQSLSELQDVALGSPRALRGRSCVSGGGMGQK